MDDNHDKFENDMAETKQLSTFDVDEIIKLNANKPCRPMDSHFFVCILRSPEKQKLVVDLHLIK